MATCEARNLWKVLPNSGWERVNIPCSREIFSPDFFIEPFQLIFLLQQGKLQVQVVPRRQDLQGAVLQLQNTSTSNIREGVCLPAHLGNQQGSKESKAKVRKQS